MPRHQCATTYIRFPLSYERVENLLQFIAFGTGVAWRRLRVSQDTPTHQSVMDGSLVFCMLHILESILSVRYTLLYNLQRNS